jgi:CHASE3 domain sensor protein
MQSVNPKVKPEIIYPKTHSFPKKVLIILGVIILIAAILLGVSLILDKLPSNAAIRQVVPQETQEQIQNTLPMIINR